VGHGLTRRANQVAAYRIVSEFLFGFLSEQVGVDA
jgi:hypothetical protein